MKRFRLDEESGYVFDTQTEEHLTTAEEVYLAMVEEDACQTARDDEAERWAKRLSWIHTEYGTDCSGIDSGDLLDGCEYEIRQALNKSVNSGIVGSELYHAINDLVHEIGHKGEIDSRHSLVDRVMGALHDVDGGTYQSPAQPVCLDAPNEEGHWWWWNEMDSASLVLVSGHKNGKFYAVKPHSRAKMEIDVTVFGGKWAKAVPPVVPEV